MSTIMKSRDNESMIEQSFIIEVDEKLFFFHLYVLMSWIEAI